MRLFIAVNFNREIKNELDDIVQKLKTNALKGRFTQIENLHLTLAFIGETENVKGIKEAMDYVNEKCFKMSLEGLGCFKRDGSCICWVGVNKTPELASIYKQLKMKLKLKGFNVEEREFLPHLTLGREVVLKEGCILEEISKDVQSIRTKVEKISLMKSERIDGKLRYTEIYHKDLG